MIVFNKGSRDKDDAWSYSAISAGSSCTRYQFVFSLPIFISKAYCVKSQ